MFPKVVKPVEGEPLVIQYEVKLETPHNCGGMYIKLLRDDPKLAAGIGEFSGDNEYTIMFGPDKCGGTDKVKTQLHSRPTPTLTTLLTLGRAVCATLRTGPLHLQAREPYHQRRRGEAR